MGREKLANRNTRKYQRDYNNGPGRQLIIRANRLRRQLQRRDGLTKNPKGKDAGHYKGSKTKGRWQSEKENRRSRLKINK